MIVTGQEIEQAFEVSYKKTNDGKELASILLSVEDGKVFYDSVVGIVPYDNNHLSVQKWELFIYHWINDSLVTGGEIGMRALINLFKKEFSFNGIIYRGMLKTPDEELYEKEFASFSDVHEVALYFAGKSEVYGFIEEEGKESYLIEVDAEDAFSFDELLLKLQTLGASKLLENMIDSFLWENEKIYPMNQKAIESIMNVG